jgi:hypothetical protein
MKTGYKGLCIFENEDELLFEIVNSLASSLYTV